MKSARAALEPVLLWLLFSLLTIAFVSSRPYLALILALLGGIAMGVSSVARHSSGLQPAGEERPGSSRAR